MDYYELRFFVTCTCQFSDVFYKKCVDEMLELWPDFDYTRQTDMFTVFSWWVTWPTPSKQEIVHRTLTRMLNDLSPLEKAIIDYD